MRLLIFIFILNINVVFCGQIISFEDGRIYYTKGQEVDFAYNVHAGRCYVKNSYVYSSYSGDIIPVGTMVKYFSNRNNEAYSNPFLILDGQYAGEWVFANIDTLVLTKEEALNLQREADNLINAERAKEVKSLGKKIEYDSFVFSEVGRILLFIFFFIFCLVALYIVLISKPNNNDSEYL